MTWRNALLQSARHHGTLGEQATPGTAKRKHKSGLQARKDERIAEAAAELQQTLSGSIVPPDLKARNLGGRMAAEPILAAAKCWEQFAKTNPHEAALIEAGVSVTDVLRTTK